MKLIDCLVVYHRDASRRIDKIRHWRQCRVPKTQTALASKITEVVPKGKECVGEVTVSAVYRPGCMPDRHVRTQAGNRLQAVPVRCPGGHLCYQVPKPFIGGLLFAGLPSIPFCRP
jgi:hypothetical protein